MSFSTSLSGVNAAQQTMDVVSNNIVNAGTIGFKKGETEFAEIYASSLQDSGQSSGQGVALTTIRSDFSQGEFSFTTSALDLAIDGSGMFVLSDGDETLYTRAGSFRIDGEGFVVTTNGARVQGFQPDNDGVITPAIGDLQISLALMQPKATGEVVFSGNLDTRTEAALTPFSAGDTDTYNFSTSTTIYDSTGTPHQLDIYFAKAAEPDGTYNVYATIDGEVQPESASMTFDGTGALTAGSDQQLDILGFTPLGADPQTFTIDLAATSGLGADSSTETLSQNGFKPGEVVSFEFDETGTVYAQYTNGEIRAMGQLLLASFINPSALSPAGNTQYRESEGSGLAVTGRPSSGSRGYIRPSALEVSNVDITQELLALLEAQRNFQSSAQAIQNEDEMSQSILNIP